MKEGWLWKSATKFKKRRRKSLFHIIWEINFYIFFYMVLYPNVSAEISPCQGRRCVSKSSVVQFWWSCANCHLSISSASRFDMLCIQGYSSAYNGYNEWLTSVAFQLKAAWPFCSDLWHQQGIFSHSEWDSLNILFLGAFLLKSWRLLEKISVVRSELVAPTTSCSKSLAAV